MSDKDHCPHMTSEVCTICQDLSEAIGLLKEAQGLIKAHWGPGGTIQRVDAFLRKHLS
jgi:hypothetical protein